MTTPQRDELARSIYASSHITGEFVLRSGAVSNEYFDKYLFEADPDLLKHIAIAMVDIVGIDPAAKQVITKDGPYVLTR